MLENFNPTSQPSSSKKEFSLIPEGVYQVQIHDIVEKQKPDFKNPSVFKNYLSFTYVILNEGELRGRRLWQDVSAIRPFPPSEGRKESWTHKVVSAIEKHSITEDEAEGFDTNKFNSLVGRQLQVIVKHSPPKATGKVYANVDSVLSAQTVLPEYEGAKKKELLPEIQIDNEDLPFN